MSISNLWRERPRGLPEPQPVLLLRIHDNAHVVPEVIEFPRSGKLRIGLHPPLMDRRVGHAEFSRLPFVDIRGDVEAVRELSRQAACIWRDESGACLVQFGWPGPGEAVRVRAQTRLLRFGRQQDAASQPFRLAHRDVVRLCGAIEYVFLELAELEDRTTPEQKKIEAFEASMARA